MIATSVFLGEIPDLFELWVPGDTASSWFAYSVIYRIMLLSWAVGLLGFLENYMTRWGFFKGYARFINGEMSSSEGEATSRTGGRTGQTTNSVSVTMTTPSSSDTRPPNSSSAAD